jgi:hypothetical protein
MDTSSLDRIEFHFERGASLRWECASVNYQLCGGAGVSPAFLQRVETRKIPGETPAPQKAFGLWLFDELRFTHQVSCEK